MMCQCLCSDFLLYNILINMHIPGWCSKDFFAPPLGSSRGLWMEITWS